MQQAKKLKVKPLITYHNGINESLKLEKVPSPPVPFPNGRVHLGQVYQHRHGDRLTVEDALN